MTREEAKRRMEICRDFLANNFSDMGEPNFTAFNMAIKALSQEPICIGKVEFDEDKLREIVKEQVARIEITAEQESTDAISRETLITKLTELIKTKRSTIEIKAKLIPMIQNMPSVTPKSGKWINDKDDMPTCSKCGYIPPYSAVIDDYEYSNYCPNCGAKMESEVRNEMPTMSLL